MTCFLQESPLDMILYYPLIKHLEEKKKEYTIYNVSNKSIIDTIHFFSQHPNIKSIVNYGVSERKLSVCMVCREYELLFINLHGDETYTDEFLCSISDGINQLGTRHFVSKQGASRFLLEKGIKTPIGVFECPITYLSRKSQSVEPFDILYIGVDEDKIGRNLQHLSQNNYSYNSLDFSKGLPENWKSIYSYLHSAKWIVSDSFIFDKPSRFLNKHFFYLGSDVLDYSNLGKSTHLVSKKLELHDYIKQSWRTLEDINPKHGLQSLLQIL